MSAKEKLAAIGYKLAKENVNSVCPWVLYSPKVPERAKMLKKTK